MAEHLLSKAVGKHRQNKAAAILHVLSGLVLPACATHFLLEANGIVQQIEHRMSIRLSTRRDKPLNSLASRTPCTVTVACWSQNSAWALLIRSMTLAHSKQSKELIRFVAL